MIASLEKAGFTVVVHEGLQLRATQVGMEEEVSSEVQKIVARWVIAIVLMVMVGIALPNVAEWFDIVLDEWIIAVAILSCLVVSVWYIHLRN